MFKNYLKLAIKVLGRRKFFTFISLFGISFTLMVLMVIMAFLDTELGANAPMTNAKRMVLVDRVEMKKEYFDTTWVVDSNLIAGEMIFDTTDYQTEPAGQSISTASPSYNTINVHLSDVGPLERRTILFDRSFDVFKDGRKYKMDAIYADGEYWNVLDFDIQAGRTFTSEHVASAASVVVVTDHLAKEFFGTDEGIIGEEIPLSGRNFEVIGVIGRTRSSSSYTRADIYLPYTTTDERLISSTETFGPWRAIYLAPSIRETTALQDALAHAGNNIPIPPEEADSYDQVRTFPFRVEEKYAWSLFRNEDIKKSLMIFRIVLFTMLGLFILIPTLNLINLNLSRMLERSSEIGVRKSFGADSSHILLQFLFENVIITLIGGVFGFVLALGVISMINGSGALPNTVLAFNWRVFFYSLLVCLAFGIISGLLPAWRMSRMHIVKGLNN